MKVSPSLYFANAIDTFPSLEAKLEAERIEKEKDEALGKEVTDLKASNTTLTTEVAALKSQASTKTASSSGGSSTPAKTTTSAPAASGGSKSFQNCTELRKKYPGGVASDHPAYLSKMNRDNDGYACEK